MEVYADFGFKDVVIKFSDRPLNRAGSDKVWDRARKISNECSGEGRV